MREPDDISKAEPYEWQAFLAIQSIIPKAIGKENVYGTALEKE